MPAALQSEAVEIVSAITSKGQVTLPAAVRRHLGLGTKDRVAFVIEPDGSVRLRAPRYRSVSALRGAAGTLATPRSWQDVRRIAHEDRLAGRAVGGETRADDGDQHRGGPQAGPQGEARGGRDRQ